MPVVNSKERAVYIVVSAAACAGCLMGVGSLLLYQRLQRDARGREMVMLRRELEDLRRIVQNLREFQPPKSGKYLASIAVADDIASALYQQHVAERSSTGSLSSKDDDSAEFFDAKSELPSNDYESLVLSSAVSNGNLPSASGDLELMYRQAETLIAYGKESTIEDRREAYDLMKLHYDRNSSNPEYLWRLSRVTYLYGRALMGFDEKKRKELCFESKDYAFDALKLDDHNADIHKMCALTIGTLGDFVSIGQKLKDGWTFKEHIDAAVDLRPNDATLRHLSGRWIHAVASLSWLERNVASTLFGAVPNGSYEEALVEFLKADRLKPDWKENQLYIALCHQGLGNTEEMKRYLEKARQAPSVSIDDASAEKEIEKLWRKYGS